MSVVPHLPENAPALGNSLSKALGRFILRVLGWRLEGDLPNEKKLMVALAPHTSNWDFVVAMPIIMALGIKVSYLMKKEAFIWPFSILFRWWGGIPLDRGASGEVVNQVAQWYADHDAVWVAITPEGTRKKVGQYKTGFVRIAHAAGVPIVTIAWDFPSKSMVVDRVWTTTGNHEADAALIRAHINSHYRGAAPQLQ
ncbi:1-acyl-sn-glycerol-3-phosphate acyltransferase [Simiduia curdlanivorans]|uniref:1-acyl-sn-glycerol-3-phosphate acyltransferase n=1 Tax=Simiduia curdlanivorans TaxID=1492769 RepID=A0ABV8V6T4_9GAMM|nr:1-acyl-sn-glycerol-3-phosphate acyltransferase [Simiduia curdlanivorans]MDN3638566.1 1-acyl-sn-glycerol-3-phosphate acyltransferase [Simiduia curdlanivorans]